MSVWPRPLASGADRARRSSLEIAAFDPVAWRFHFREDFLLHGFDGPVTVEPTFLHELAHFLQQAATPYGYYLTHLDRFQNQQVRSFCQTVLGAGQGQRIMVPIRGWIESCSTRSVAPTVLEAKERYLDPWSHAEYLRTSLEGGIELRPEWNRQPSWGVESAGTVAGGPPPDLGGVDCSCPSIDDRPLGAALIAECWADIVEMIALVTESRESPANLNPGRELDRRFDQGNLVMIGRLVTGELPSLPWDVLLMVQLALCEISFASALIFEDFRSLAWSDLHPGWRLARCVEALSSVPPPSLGRGAADYDRYLEALCRQQGWPSPRQIACHIKQHAPPPGGAQDRVFQRACVLRSELPTILVHPQHDENWDSIWRQLLDGFLPGSTLAGGTHRFAPGAQKANVEYQASAFVTHAARWLMEGECREDLFPDWFYAARPGDLVPRELEASSFQRAFGFPLNRIQTTSPAR